MAYPRFPVKPEDQEALSTARDDIHALGDAVEETLLQCFEAPAAGSAIENCKPRDPDRYWLGAAYSCINVAVDHLRGLAQAWSAKERGGLPHTAGFTLIRGATEAAARGCWLSDPALSNSSRIARGILEWDYSIERFTQHAHDAPRARGLRTTLTTTIAGDRIMLVGRKVQGRTCRGEKRPFITDLIKAQLPRLGGPAYGLLSGYAHAEVWVTLFDRIPAGADKGYVVVDVPKQLALLRDAALPLVGQAVGSIVQLAGHDRAEWDARTTALIVGT
jgi:hypothetical protein